MMARLEVVRMGSPPREFIIEGWCSRAPRVPAQAYRLARSLPPRGRPDAGNNAERAMSTAIYAPIGRLRRLSAAA